MLSIFRVCLRHATYPEHWTQGDDLADLKEQLRDLYQTFSTEDIPGIRKEEELEVAGSGGI